MSKPVVCTNNPAVVEKEPASVYIDSDVLGVFTAVRDYIHKGAVLVSHPLSSSIKPNESPYKSVVVTMRQGAVDYKSLQIIEDALNVLERLPKKRRDFTESVLEDFRVIDLDIVNSALSGMTH